jgi:hypothetical protein
MAKESNRHLRNDIKSQPRTREPVRINSWDELDPVANAVLALVEAQNNFQRAIDGLVEARDDGSFATDEEWSDALRARTDAVIRLFAAEIGVYRNR